MRSTKRSSVRVSAVLVRTRQSTQHTSPTSPRHHSCRSYSPRSSSRPPSGEPGQSHPRRPSKHRPGARWSTGNGASSLHSRDALASAQNTRDATAGAASSASSITARNCGSWTVSHTAKVGEDRRSPQQPGVHPRELVGSKCGLGGSTVRDSWGGAPRTELW